MNQDPIQNFILQSLLGNMEQGTYSDPYNLATQGGNDIGNLAAGALTSNKMLQGMIQPYIARMMGQTISAYTGAGPFAGFSGLGTHDNAANRLYAANARAMRNAQASIGRSVASAGSLGENIGEYLQGTGALARGLDITQTGYSFMPVGMAGSYQQDAQDRNDRSRKLFFGANGSGGLVKSLTKDFSANSMKYGGMSGGELSSVVNNMLGRGELSADTGDMDKIKEKISRTAKAVKSLADVIKGPVQEIMRQLEDSFGGATISTIGIERAFNVGNQMRVAGQMGGYSMNQMLALTNDLRGPMSQMDNKSAGIGAASIAMGTAGYTGLMRGQNQSFIDSNTMTQGTAEWLMGKRESLTGRLATAAEILVGNQNPDKQRAFREAVYKMSASGKEIGTTQLVEVARGMGIKLTESELYNMQNSREVDKYQGQFGMNVAVGNEANLVKNTRGDVLRQVLGSNYEKIKARLKAGGKDIDFADQGTITAQLKASDVNIGSVDWDTLSSFDKSSFHGVPEERLATLQNAEQKRMRDELVTNMANLASKSGAGEAVGNVLGEFAKTGNLKGLQDAILGGKNYRQYQEGLLEAYEQVHGVSKDGKEAGIARIKAMLGKIGGAVGDKEMGLDAKQTLEFINATTLDIMSGQVDENGIVLTEDQIVARNLLATKTDISLGLTSEDMGTSIKEGLDKLRGKKGSALTITEEKTEVRRQQREALLRSTEKAFAAANAKGGDTPARQKAQAEARALLKNTDAAGLDEALKDEKNRAKFIEGGISEESLAKVDVGLAKSESNVMDKIFEVLSSLFESITQFIKWLTNLIGSSDKGGGSSGGGTLDQFLEYIQIALKAREAKTAA